MFGLMILLMTLQQFQERFHNEAACRSFLFLSRWPHGFCCPRCGHGEHYYIQTRELYECCECHAQTSVTAGTVMHGTKLSLQYWFLVMYMVAFGERCSARWLADTLRLNYRTALRMLRAVRHAMRKQNGPHPLSNILKTDNVTSDIFREKPETIETPVAALDVRSDQNPYESPAREIASIGDHLRETDFPVMQANVVTRAKEIMMGKVRQFIRLTYRSVHREYLQSYVDEYYFRWVGRFDAGRSLFDLLCACASATPYQNC